MLQKLLPALMLLSIHAFGQEYAYVYKNPADSSVNCYLKVMPVGSEIRGIIVRDYSSLPDMKAKPRFKFAELAAEKGYIVLYTVSSTYFPEMYYNDSCIWLLDEMIEEVIKIHQVPRQNLFIGGISASGTRALRFAQYCEQEKSKYGHKVKGVFSVDSPLDLERFYYSAHNHKQHFKAGMLWEADLMSRVFPEKLGTPAEKPDAYLKASVFSHRDISGGNAGLLKQVSVILFHEPDLDWWMDERGCSYYDFNSFDIAAFVIKLRDLGHQDVTLITTSGKGYDSEGKRNCHSWSIVDEPYLINWIVSRTT